MEKVTKVKSVVKEEKPKMVKQFRAGKVTATIFEKTMEKEGKTFQVYSTKVVKSYTTDDGKTWTETNNFQKDELVKVEIVTRRAIEYLYLTE